MVGVGQCTGWYNFTQSDIRRKDLEKLNEQP